MDFDDEDPFAIPPIETGILSYPVLLNSLSLKANAITVLYKENLNVKTLEVALETQEIANLLTEKMRSMFLGQESKLLITETSRNGYDQAIRIAYDLYMLTDEPFYANKAFMSAEKGKSSVLLASLQEVENKNNLGIPQDLQDKEQLVKNKSEFYKKLLYEEKQRPMPDSTQIGVWQGNLLAISQEHDSITSIINTRFPEYASKYDNDVIDLEGIQNGLRDNQVLMEYSITDTSLFIFAIEKRAFSIKRIPIDSTFYRNIDILSKFLRNNEFANNTFSDYTNYTESAYRLYETLVLPVEPQIEGKALIIIPDGELGYLPFECLLTSKDGADKMDYRKLPYLIFNFKTSYSYSATLLFTENDKKHPSNRRVIAFAPTYENISNISSSKFPANRDYSSYLVPLKFITEEIKNISAIIDCDKYEGFEATEANFKENAHHYDILHLAMHTLINDENPMYSKLVFTLNNDTIEENDGLLNTYEIFNMEFSAQMAVLSACTTGYGKLRKGEGIMSLARGFIYAGVPSIIMTLWAVEDQSGSILMSTFYENLVDGQEIDAALRSSKLQYLETADQLSAHPYLWSGYVSIGSTKPLIDKSGKIVQYAVVGIILLGLILFLLWLRRKKKV